MTGITEDQAEQIIDLLKDILDELKYLRGESGADSIVEELREANRTLSGIERDVSSIEGKE